MGLTRIEFVVDVSYGGSFQHFALVRSLRTHLYSISNTGRKPQMLGRPPMLAKYMFKWIFFGVESAKLIAEESKSTQKSSFVSFKKRIKLRFF